MKIDQPTPPKSRRKTWLKRASLALSICFFYVFFLQHVWCYFFDSEIVISKETTCLTEPILDPETLDYVAAINKIQSAGVTPEMNAAVLLTRALGPVALGENNTELFYDQLGIAPLPQKGSYLISMTEYEREFLGDDNKVWVKFEENQGVACTRPWSREEFPQVASWIDHNTEQLKLILQAATKPHLYIPVVAGKDTSQGAILSNLLTLQQSSRDVMRLLVSRALLFADNDDLNQAFADLLALRRLGRLLQKGANSIDYAIGISFESVAFTAEIGLLNAGKLSMENLNFYLKQLQEIGRPVSSVEVVDKRGRISSLDSILHFMYSLMPEDQMLQTKLNRNYYFDLNHLLRMTNQNIDRMVGVMSLEKHADRVNGFAEFEREVDKVGNNFFSLISLAWGKVSRKSRTESYAEITNALLLPPFSFIREAEDRAVTRYRLLQIALTLEKKKLDQGEYPDTLNALKDLLPQETLFDPYTGKSFIYRRVDTGYLLYSVGHNMQDEDGKGYDNVSKNDDIKIQIGKPE